LSPYTSGRQTFFIAAQITFSIAIEGPLHLQPLEQNESGTGNMQLPDNSPGVYVVHVLFSQFVFFSINGPGGLPDNPGTLLPPQYLVKIGAVS